jgi:cell division protein FtsL
MNTRPPNNDQDKLNVLWRNNEKITREKIHLFLGTLVAALFFIVIVLLIFLQALSILR